MIDVTELNSFVEHNINIFHTKRIEGLKKLKLLDILKRKNPYLFKAKYYMTSQDIVKALIDAHLSFPEESHFGEFLETLAIFVNSTAYREYKSSEKRIDLDFNKSGIRYLVSIKSGSNCGNSNQIAKMRDDFRKAAKTLCTSGSDLNIIAVKSCCYSKSINSNKGDYFKYFGQEFWSIISGEEDYYLKIIEPVGYQAKQKIMNFLNNIISWAINYLMNSFQNFVMKPVLETV